MDLPLAARLAARPRRGSLIRQVALFAMVGAGRTAISLGLYLLLTLVVPYWLAFSIAFVVGITFSAIMNGRFVFVVGLSLRTYVRYTGVYLANYLVSLGLLVALVEWFRLPPYLAPVVVIALLFPLNFVTERYALLRGRRRAAPSE
jgi:putative flippase GtrA